MATVTGLTAARMLQIEDASVVSGTVTGDDLILTTYGGTQINAGNVRGPQGIQGIQGPVGQVLPTGTIIAGGWTSDPAGGLLLDGRTIVGGATTYSALAAVYPNWVNGSDLILPDTEGAFLRAYTLNGNSGNPGDVSGSDTIQLTTNNLPPHDHSMQAHTHTAGTYSTDIDHDHPQATTSGQSQDHNHGPNSAGQGFVITGFGGDPDYPNALYDGGSGGDVSKRDATNTTSNDHTHTFNVPNYNAANRATVGQSGEPSHSVTGDTGGGIPIAYDPRSLTVRFAVLI